MKISDAAVAKTIQDNIDAARLAFPASCVDGQVVKVAYMNCVTDMEVGKYIEAGVQAQIDAIGATEEKTGIVEYASVDEQFGLCFRSIKVTVE